MIEFIFVSLGGGANLLAVPLGFRSQKLNQHPLQYLLVYPLLQAPVLGWS